MPTANLSDIEPVPATSGGGHANLSDIEGPASPGPNFAPAAPGSDIGHPQLGPSPQAARVGNEMFRNLANLPAGVMAFIRHPIETTKAAVGQMDLEHPEKSSGLLGLPDVLYRELQSGQGPEAIAHLAEVAAPGLLREGGLGEAAASARLPGVVSSAVRGGVRGGVEAIPNAIETSLLRYTGLPQIGRGVVTGAKRALAQRNAAVPWSTALQKASQIEPAPLPQSVMSELTRPSEVAQAPAEAMTQLNTQAAKPPAPVVPIATRMAATARAVRGSTADTLAQTLENEGLADVGQTMPVFKLGDFARLHKIAWPADQPARLSLMEATRAVLRQRTTKP